MTQGLRLALMANDLLVSKLIKYIFGLIDTTAYKIKLYNNT